jgi:hypothetical protein
MSPLDEIHDSFLPDFAADVARSADASNVAIGNWATVQSVDR